jgi:hypothetical protein
MDENKGVRRDLDQSVELLRHFKELATYFQHWAEPETLIFAFVDWVVGDLGT